MAKIYYALILTLVIHIDVHAASCCGGGSSASTLIIADHLQEWTLSTQFRSDIGQSNNDGKALMDASSNQDHTSTTNLEYKKQLTSRFQGNFGLTFIHKNSKRLGKEESSSGFGDLGLGSFYELLTNYNYSELNPRLFAGLKFIVPFGDNNFNSNKELRTDIRGSGFYKIDVPVVLVIEQWKFSLSPQYLPKQKELSSTYAFTTAGSYTYAFNDQFDLSMTVQWSYLATKKFQNLRVLVGQYWELSLAPSWILSPTASINLNYSDSSLIGKNRNSAIYRSLALGLTVSELL